jgi:dihydrofolate synthase/folylpolyglutamate synthase
MDYAAALAYLDAHANYDTTGRIDAPTLERIERLCAVMGDPQHAYPVIHVTGTNGKGSVTQMVTRLLMAHGLRVGSYTSPHLEVINERLSLDGVPIGDDEFARQVQGIADAEIVAGVRPSYFEICTAAAFRWFADEAIDAAVVEVGLLGRWDATNVVNAQVAIATNIGLEHTEFAGPTKADIAREKAGIIKPGSSVVIGEADPELVEIFLQPPHERAWCRGEEFDVTDNELALGGRLVEVRTPNARYSDLFVPLHGRHQADNAAVALTAVEAFFDTPLDNDVVEEAFADVRMPGRFEVMGHQPLVIIDGAHNPTGADVCADVFFTDFDPVGGRVLVVGCLRGREPRALLEAFRADEFDLVITCTAPSPRGIPTKEIAQAAVDMGCDDVIATESVVEACDRALAGRSADDAVLVSGSLYVVGAARPHLRKVLP